MSAARALLLAGCAAGGLAVILGAFGAHALKSRLPDTALATFDTGVRYQMFHALALLLVAAMADRLGGSLALTAGWLFATGIVLFSGSLYLLSARSLLGIESWRWLGPITPLGGMCYIAGWVILAVAAFRAP